LSTKVFYTGTVNFGLIEQLEVLYFLKRK